ILEITRTPELCAQVTTMPVETFGVDGAVLYADIMLPLYGMGGAFSFPPAVDAVKAVEGEDAAPELFETIRMLRRDLEGRAALIGFAGAPYTVASYLIEGRPSKEHAHAKALLYGDEVTWHRLMETLTEVTVRYLRAQVAAGVQVVQLFDSWMGDLGRREYEAAVLPYRRRIFEAVRATGVPTIHFGTGTVGLLEAMAGAGSDLVSVDWGGGPAQGCVSRGPTPAATWSAWTGGCRWTRPGGGSARARGSRATSTRPCCWPPS